MNYKDFKSFDGTNKKIFCGATKNKTYKDLDYSKNRKNQAMFIAVMFVLVFGLVFFFALVFPFIK